jgi:hypothetical protein
MQDDFTTDSELRDRLSLIENMIAEGRRTTESWGWTFVLWGVAYYVAMAWSYFANSNYAWPVTMIAACALMGVLISRKAQQRPETTIGRSMMAIWLSMGISLFLLLLCLGLGGRFDFHIFVAIIGAMLGMANATSSVILRWKMQFAGAMVWWAAAAAACFTSDKLTVAAFILAIFFCQIVFGIYGMIAESREIKARSARQGASHA